MGQSLSPGTLVISVLNEIDRGFPDNTAENVRELIGSGEPGIALEVLCAQLFEYSIVVSGESKLSLKKAANLMSIPLSKLDGLE